MSALDPTPSHTVGPFYGYALPFPGGGEIAPFGHPDTITLHGYVLDGEGAPVPDALVEIWGPGPDGELPRRGGSMRRDPVTGGFLGRNGVDFTGFGRVPTDADGHWTVRTLRPGRRGASAPYLSLCVFARGLTHHLFTRAYLPEPAEARAADPLLASLPPARAATLVAHPEPNHPEPNRTYRFDIRLQGDGSQGAGSRGEDETVFLEFT
ncbi:protocatechuate 3,4-dioxygenase subunit alpha [Streptomyces sp. NPDC006307]|uniref:protocatechuate 3,4-dioxygenase subunit alpha n=1 Tax=Streptomyces sp. NPDC006307 TaxID=3156748 RepID=UPI0033A9CA33